MSLSIYLAGRYQSKDKLAKIGNALKDQGYEITARWLYDFQGSAKESAVGDMDDVKKADYLVSFTEEPAIGYNTGGRHVEFGAAWAWGKKLVLVGPRENIFHHLPDVVQVYSVEELYIYLAEEDRLAPLT